MKLYNEMKELVRETYSNTSKQFDGYFKKSSIEGYVQRKEKLIYKQKVLEHKKFLAENNSRRVEHLLDQLIALQNKRQNRKHVNISNDITKTNDNSNESIDYNFNLDDEISSIFKRCESEKPMQKSKSVLSKKMQMLHLKTQDKIKRRIIELSKIKERNYNPNYNSIYPKIQVFSFSTLPKQMKIKKLFKKEICTKFDKHENQFKFNRTICKGNKNFASNITVQDNSYFNMAENITDTISRNNSNYSIIIHTKKRIEDPNTSRLISYKNNSSSSFSTLITAASSRKLRKTKIKPLNFIKAEETEENILN
jgi:hypothetical protein